MSKVPKKGCFDCGKKFGVDLQQEIDDATVWVDQNPCTKYPSAVSFVKLEKLRYVSDDGKREYCRDCLKKMDDRVIEANAILEKEDRSLKRKREGSSESEVVKKKKRKLL